MRDSNVFMLLPPHRRFPVSPYSYRFYKPLCRLTPTVFTSACVVFFPPFLQAPVSSYSYRFHKRLCRLIPTVFTSARVILLLPFLQAPVSSYSYRFYKRLYRLTSIMRKKSCFKTRLHRKFGEKEP